MATTNRKFEVIHGSFGPWTLNSVFNEVKFREMVPCPDKTEKETYYNALLNRGVSVGTLRQCPADAVETPDPIGPGGKLGTAGSIDAAAEAVVSQRAMQSQAIGQISPEVKPPVEKPVVKQGAIASA
jgi:hypothetical protein